MKHKNLYQNQKKIPPDGFSMVEVLIAGILLASSLIAVSRMSVAALSSSAGISDRARIEAAINDDIQAMQKEDSYFTSEWIKANGDFRNACSNPPQALESHLKLVVPQPRTKKVIRSFDAETVPRILRVVYNFQGPEQQIDSELRVIEMSPNFAAQCYTTR